MEDPHVAAPSDDIATHQFNTGRVSDGAASTTKADGPADTFTGTATSIYASYCRRTARHVAMFLGLATLLLAVFFVAFMVGSLGFSLTQALGALFDADCDPWAASIAINLRLPPALLVILVGEALPLAGVQIQTVLDNPLTEPFIPGISTASAPGAALATIAGFVLPMVTGATLPTTAMTAGLAISFTTVMVLRPPSVIREMTILLGIVLVFSCQALLALVQHRASTESPRQAIFWSMGFLMHTAWPAVAAVSAALLVATPVFQINGWRLTAIILGETCAVAMGISVARSHTRTLVSVSLLVALSVAFVGIVGFVGFMGPHMARGLVGEDQRSLISASILCGATLLTATHTASQLIMLGVAVSAGILTTLMSMPMSLTIIFGRRRSAVGSGP